MKEILSIMNTPPPPQMKCKKDNKRPMGNITHLRNISKSINILVQNYHYICTIRKTDNIIF